MKNLFHLFCFCLTIVFLTNTAYGQSNEYYLGLLSNTSKTIKFTIYAYPGSVSQVKRNDGSVYSGMRIAIINDEKAEPIEWSDYKIYILLKDGTLFYNFLTTAATGDYACKYTVPPGEKHLQFACFEKVFTAADIDKVWLSFSANQFLPLFLYKDEDKPTTTPAEEPAINPTKK